MRCATREDLDEIKRSYEEKGFPLFVCALNCSKLFWKTCPTQKQANNRTINNQRICDACNINAGAPLTSTDGTVTLVEQARRKKSTCWHCQVCSKKSHTYDFNVAYKMCKGILPDGGEVLLSYRRGGIIYPEWPRFCKLIKDSDVPKEWRFSRNQELARNDLERLIGGFNRPLIYVQENYVHEKSIIFCSLPNSA